jgi:Glycosyl transferase family 2/Galactosyltransferase
MLARRLWPWLSRGGRHAGPNSNAKPVSVPPARGVVERIEKSVLIGWAALPDGRIGDVEVHLDGQALPIAVRRMERLDVSQALKLPPDGNYGFEARLTPLVWARVADGTSAKLSVVVDGHELPRRFTLSNQALNEVQGVGVAALSGAPTGIVGAIESHAALVVRGWVDDTLRQEQPLELRAAGRAINAAAWLAPPAAPPSAAGTRITRFELELPADIWRTGVDQGRIELRLLAAGTDLAGSPWTVDAAVIGDEANLQKQAQAAMEAADIVHDPGRRQHRELLLLEHAIEMPTLKALTAGQLAYVVELARRYAVHLPTLPALGATAGAAPQPVAEVPASTIAHWAAVRRLHAALDAEAHLPWQTFAAEYAAAGGNEEKRLLLLSVMPTLCAQQQIDKLAELVEPAVMALLLASEDVCNLSVALLLQARTAPGDEVSALFRRAHKRIDKGWLNTECFAEATRSVIARQRRGDFDAGQADTSFRAVMGALRRYSEDHASRLNDRHLQACMWALVLHAPLLEDSRSAEVIELAIRLYGMQPGFWRQAEGTPVHHPLLNAAREHFHVIKTTLQGAPPRMAPVAALREPLDFFLRLGNRDAQGLARQMAQSLATHSRHQADAASSLQTAVSSLRQSAPEEFVRFAAFPGRPLEIDDTHAYTLSQQVMAIDSIPRSRRQGPRDFAWSKLRESLHAAQQPREPGLHADLVSEVDAATEILTAREHGWVGVSIAASALLAWREAGWPHPRGWANLGKLLTRTLGQADAAAAPPAPVTDALHALGAAQASRFDPALAPLLADAQQALQQRFPHFREAIEAALAQRDTLVPRPHVLADTLVVVYSCCKYLPTRIPALRQTWLQSLAALGVPYLVLVGGGNNRIAGDVLALDVSDAYEDLPAKTLAMIEWVFTHTNFQRLYKIDDDCYVDAEKLFASGRHRPHHCHGRLLYREPGSTDRRWHQGKSSSERARHALDKSPEPSIYADGGSGYNLSRFAMASVLAARHTPRGERLVRSSFMEDKLVGDLLALGGIEADGSDYPTLIRRRTHAGGIAVNMVENTFLPSAASPTVMAHLDGVEEMDAVHAGRLGAALRPARIWPTHTPPSLGFKSNQLELLSPAARLADLASAPVMVVAVARNESTLLPHFLAHYRRLGAGHFVIVDNLSDDGSREGLLQQPDVTLYSADTEYRHSHFGVTWQEAVLAAHGLGRWAVLADIDEFLVYRSSATRPLPVLTSELQAQGADAALVLMVDMYPQGDLDDADFATTDPFQAANCHDQRPLLHWRLGAGAYSNSDNYLSALRHRLIPDSAPNMYTSQKVALLRYQPWMRLSEGLHCASGVSRARERLAFAHFKYHRGFREKVMQEIARKQHFDDASEYRRYMNMLSEAGGRFFDPALSQHYQGPDALLDMLDKQLGPAART